LLTEFTWRGGVSGEEIEGKEIIIMKRRVFSSKF